MEKGSIPGVMEQSTLVILRTVSSTAKVNGEVVEDLSPIVMRATISMIGSVDTGSSSGPLEIFTKVSTKRMSAMGMARCIGLMAVATKANGLLAFSTGTAE